MYDSDSASDALALMTLRRFRHLPVISDAVNSASTTNVVGLLDIARFFSSHHTIRCIYDKLPQLESKSTEDSTILSYDSFLK